MFAENVEYRLDDEELDEENTKDIYYNEGDDEVDSDEDEAILNDGEDVSSTYPTFNTEVDFKGKIKLTLGLKFHSNMVFRKALRHHAIESGYDLLFA